MPQMISISIRFLLELLAGIQQDLPKQTRDRFSESLTQVTDKQLSQQPALCAVVIVVAVDTTIKFAQLAANYANAICILSCQSHIRSQYLDQKAKRSPPGVLSVATLLPRSSRERSSSSLSLNIGLESSIDQFATTANYEALRGRSSSPCFVVMNNIPVPVERKRSRKRPCRC